MLFLPQKVELGQEAERGDESDLGLLVSVARAR